MTFSAPSLALTRAGSSLDKLGMIVAAMVLSGLGLLPFALFRANRIVSSRPESLWNALPGPHALAVGLVVAGTAIVLLWRAPAGLRLALSLVALCVLTLMMGQAADHLTPAGNAYARVSPGSGFWLMIFGLAIAMADAIVRLKLSPWARIGLLLAGIAAIGLLLGTGAWSGMSILREYDNRADAFWREARVHLFLAVGSLAAAAAIGIPTGILCYRVRRVRTVILNTLNVVQTGPSMALFGLMIAPLGWIGHHVPGAAAIGIAGIGAAPAFVALFAYALLPMVSNTVAGLDNVPPAARDAARGMGMTPGQRLAFIELPLAFPVILTGIRIVLVQNIGLAVIAGLIGGGGLGTFIFQGISQTATDLVLLGALPVVGMAFAAAIILDALVEMTRGNGMAGMDP